MKFIHNLVKYCGQQESRQEGILREAIEFRVASTGGEYAIDLKRRASEADLDVNQQPKRVRERTYLKSPNRMRNFGQIREDDEIISTAPTMFTSHVCLLCIRVGKIRWFKKRDTLGKHINHHKAEGAFEQGFCCWDPYCLVTQPSSMAYGIQLRGIVR